MSIFCYKNLAPAIRLGKLLKAKRKKLKLSVAKIAALTYVQPKYVQAIEQGCYHNLPPTKAHRLAYIRSFAAAVGLDTSDCLNQFDWEEGLNDAPSIHPKRNVKLFPFASVSIFLRNSLVIVLALFFVGYLGWQVKGILRPPHLAIYAPLEGYITSQPAALVQGETEKESGLKVNGQEVMVNEQGQFETKIDLSEGVNTITIEATKKHGKTTTEVRHLIVKPNSSL
jgi:transcriptional regulator with XRE-family HTH domain